MNAYYNVKLNHYNRGSTNPRDSIEREDCPVYPIIVGKNCSLHAESLKVLKYTFKMTEEEIFEQIGLTLNYYFKRCQIEAQNVANRISDGI